MVKPKLLDLFCKAGGTSVGYHRAGFKVTGVDIQPQKNYPFEFHQCDWAEYLLANYWRYDVIAASPPCQPYSRLAHLATGNVPKLIEPVRAALQWIGKPYIIENVAHGPLLNPIMLCGSMFNLRVYRHRYFECSPALWWVPFSCNHWAARGRGPTDSKRVNGKRVTASLKNSDVLSVTGHGYITPDGRAAMGIDWMTRDELSQAIPPRYTEYLGKKMMKLWK